MKYLIGAELVLLAPVALLVVVLAVLELAAWYEDLKELRAKKPAAGRRR